MSDKKSLQLAKQVKRDIQRGFGKRVCKELHLECGSCKAQVFIGHLNWYIDLLEWSITQDKKKKQPKIKRSK